MKRLFISLLILISCTQILFAQQSITMLRMNRQQNFRNKIPAGNYSGISRINDSIYAVVSDKSIQEGFFLFLIKIDSINGRILYVKNLGFKGSTVVDRDQEGIVYMPESKTLLISGEKDKNIIEYSLNGQRTGREATIPRLLRSASFDLGMESLAYNDSTHTLWTCTEGPLPIDVPTALNQQSAKKYIRIQAFNIDLHPTLQYAYKMDLPMKQQHKATHYVHGISEMTTLKDGSLLVLEREFYVPKFKIGASVNCKIYHVRPDQETTLLSDKPLSDKSPFVTKQLVCQWKTKLNLINRSLANYEGLCLGPTLQNGASVFILVSDSQNQYAGVLKDWFKTIVIQKNDNR